MAIAATLTLAGVVVVGIPASVYALSDPYTGDAGVVGSGVTLNVNNGSIAVNEGTINTNNNSVNINFSNVTNSDTGVVVSNRQGATVAGGGSVYQNAGSVTGNSSVTNNYGEVSGDGNVETNESGGTVSGNGNVGTNKAGGTVSGTGTITITPNEGYEINGDTGTNLAGTNFTYSLERNGNNVVVTLSAPTGAVTINPAALNLLITAIQQGGGNVVVRTDSSVIVTDNETRSSNETTGTTSAAGNVITAAQINAMIESALAANPGATVIDIDLGNDPSFTADTLIALCEMNIVAKNCHFTHNGIKSILFIPVIDPTSAAYKQCKALLDEEPGKQAGPIRLYQIFAPVGFSLPQK
ncbi:MAG: hypothetical protein K6G22_08360 [Lachnospiraceae bacterium]|nr:hypothetical protein [Lachnospiraceae bacterium]